LSTHAPSRIYEIHDDHGGVVLPETVDAVLAGCEAVA